jgi:hypothetical protein
MAWTDRGPVSVPPNSVVVFIGLVMCAAAIGGVALGFKASWRDAKAPEQGLVDTQSSGQATLAQPIVELPQPQAAPAPANVAVAASNSAKDDTDDSSDIAEKTAAAQAVQSKPAQASSNIDDILTSPSEKPQAPAKPSTDEAPPTTPPKSDVPF